YAQVIRDHWGIENNCHWVLDVLYREDGSRSRPEHGAENLAWLRRMALSLLKNDTTCERSLRAKSAKALGDHDFLLQLLSQVTGGQDGTQALPFSCTAGFIRPVSVRDCTKQLY